MVLLIAEATVVAMSLTAATGTSDTTTADTATTANTAGAAQLVGLAWWLLPACAALYTVLTFLLWRTATAVHVRGQRLRWIASLDRGTLHVSRPRPVWPRRIPLRSRLGVALIRERGGGWVLVWIGPDLAGLVEQLQLPGHLERFLHSEQAGQAGRPRRRALP